MADKTTSNIGFEKQIWDAACVLRGNIDASEYKSVVLGLIFLKYISDRFEAKYRELVDEGDGFEEDIDEYISENIFFVPENARWGVIASSAHTPEIGTVIDEAMRSIEKENKRLKDMFEQIKCNAIENDRLKQLRDSLLPKLMNGEIDVSAIQL
ncbi:type I restriction-modification system subunit M N-terminal domain-containing protein [Agathobaculum sp. LCP25S3_E8]|uniref:type I restriction-modification system subunit M N-terminal domain-containing protein n=1 Tax=Agathobaculum sp. LCP25S3_E8 TaxID=3438735 RepID=UPI003F93394D